MADMYLIKAETLTAIADRTRGLANTEEELTTDDIIYWLGRIKGMGQGHVSSALSVTFETSAEGALQEE